MSSNMDPQAAFTDAMSVLWSRMGMVYSFPPFKMIPVVLAKLRQSQAITMILLAPYQMDTLWMPGLLQLAWDTSIPIADEWTILTHLVHRTNGGAETRTHIYLYGNFERVIPTAGIFTIFIGANDTNIETIYHQHLWDIGNVLFLIVTRRNITFFMSTANSSVDI